MLLMLLPTRSGLCKALRTHPCPLPPGSAAAVLGGPGRAPTAGGWLAGWAPGLPDSTQPCLVLRAGIGAGPAWAAHGLPSCCMYPWVIWLGSGVSGLGSGLGRPPPGQGTRQAARPAADLLPSLSQPACPALPSCPAADTGAARRGVPAHPRGAHAALHLHLFCLQGECTILGGEPGNTKVQEGQPQVTGLCPCVFSHEAKQEFTLLANKRMCVPLPQTPGADHGGRVCGDGTARGGQRLPAAGGQGHGAGEEGGGKEGRRALGQ